MVMGARALPYQQPEQRFKLIKGIGIAIDWLSSQNSAKFAQMLVNSIMCEQSSRRSSLQRSRL